MIRKAPAGAKHAGCLSHVPHNYPKSGFLCITTDRENVAWPNGHDMRPIDRPAAMVEFADHLAAVAARHRASGPRPILDAVEHTGSRYRDSLPDGAEGPTLAESDWRHPILSSQLPVLPYAAQACASMPDGPCTLRAYHVGAHTAGPTAAPVELAPAPVKVRKARKAPAATLAPVESAPMPDARSTIVDYSRPMPAGFTVSDPFGALSQPAGPERAPAPVAVESADHIGYSWTIEAGPVEVFTRGASVIRAPLSNPIGPDGYRVGREWWPTGDAYSAQWRPLVWPTVEEAQADMTASRADDDARILAESAPEPMPDAAPVESAGDRAMLAAAAAMYGPVAARQRHGRRERSRNLAAIRSRAERARSRVPAPVRASGPVAADLAPVPSAPVLAALPSTADGRPTCPRCGQTFRKSGTGLAWHVANRADCAAIRPALVVAS